MDRAGCALAPLVQAGCGVGGLDCPQSPIGILDRTSRLQCSGKQAGLPLAGSYDADGKLAARSGRPRRTTVANVELNLDELQPGRLQAVDQERGNLFHDGIAISLIRLAILAQARGWEGNGVGVLFGHRVEVPAIRREKPRPPQHLAGANALDRDGMPRRMRLEPDLVASDEIEMLRLSPS